MRMWIVTALAWWENVRQDAAAYAAWQREADKLRGHQEP